MVTMFKAGNALAIGDVVHPTEGEPVQVVHVNPQGARAIVSFANGTCEELTADEVVEVEVPDLTLVSNTSVYGGASAGSIVAFRRDGRWHDPHGGVFTASEQSDLDEVATGERTSVMLGAGTKYTRTIWLRRSA